MKDSALTEYAKPEDIYPSPIQPGKRVRIITNVPGALDFFRWEGIIRDSVTGGPNDVVVEFDSLPQGERLWQFPVSDVEIVG